MSFNTEKNILLFPAYYPKRNCQKTNIYAIITGLITLIISLSQLLSMIMHIVVARNDLSKLSEILLFFITHLTYLCKLANFEYYKNNMFQIEDFLTCPKFYGFAFSELEKLKEKIAGTKMVGRTFRILCVFSVIAWGMVPYLDHSKRSALPLPGWLPYNVTKYYYPTFGFQMVALSITACFNSTLDILSWMLITLATIQFDVLKNKLNEIHYERGLESLEKDLKTCVEHHKEIISYVYKIENTFSKGIFLQFFASVIVICFTGFSIMIVPLWSMQFGYLLFYFFCMMLQVGMYCWYGHDVMTTSNEIGQYFYMSNWYESDLSIRKDMIIFLERTKKPITLTAGNFITLSLTTLTRILRSSYSYFAVLQHMYNDS